jgi:hypothetical protein
MQKYNGPIDRERTMKAMAWMLMLVLLTGDFAIAGNKDEQQACETVKKQIRAIEAKMRNGYSAAQGIRYDERLRELKKRRNKLCR